MEEIAPPALVLGCNTTHGIGVLSDWIEERTGVAPDFVDIGWGDSAFSSLNSGNGRSNYGHEHCNGVRYLTTLFAYGDGYGDGTGDGSVDRHGYGLSYGDGYGDGTGYGASEGDGTGYGFDCE